MLGPAKYAEPPVGPVPKVQTYVNGGLTSSPLASLISDLRPNKFGSSTNSSSSSQLLKLGDGHSKRSPSRTWCSKTFSIPKPEVRPQLPVVRSMSSCTTVEDSPLTQGTTETIHRVVGLPELLYIIFSNLEDDDLARAARVCQLWSSIALNRLWEEIPNIGYLFELYSPLESDEDEILHFEDVSNGGHWDNFWARACRVRKVSEWEEEYGPDVIPHLLRQVKNSGSGQTFLPNLREIGFSGYSSKAQILPIFSLIPSGLEALTLECCKNFGSSALLKLNKALAKSSVERLKVVELSSSPQASQARKRACIKILHQQKFLERLRLSSLGLTTKDIEKIGELPHLTALDLNDLQFRSVRKLREAFGTIGKLFPNLQRICLKSDIEERMDIMVMEGLAPCHELREVTLRCTRLQPVTAEAIGTLARYWPKLEKLAFTPFYYPSNPAGASLAILEDVALAWPETLVRLSLMWDTSQEIPQATAVRWRFKQKVVLYMGYSVLHKDQVTPLPNS